VLKLNPGQFSREIERAQDLLSDSMELASKHDSPVLARVVEQVVAAIAIILTGIVPGLIFKAIHSAVHTGEVSLVREKTRAQVILEGLHTRIAPLKNDMGPRSMG
jgi:hypothetical protein